MSLYFAFSYMILSELLYSLKLRIEETFGVDFFKTIKIVGSFTDSIKDSNRLLTRDALNLETPALLIEVQDIRPDNKLNPLFTRRVNISPGNMLYPLIYNQTKDTGLVANLEYYSLTLNLYINVTSEFLMLDIKRYLEKFFPLNIPQQFDYIQTLIPLSTSLKKTLEDNYNWDFDTDEIYYIYRQIDYLTGAEKLFIPFILNPLITNQSTEKFDKEKLSNRITTSNQVLFELKFFLPVNTFIYKNKKIIEKINIHFSELISEEIAVIDEYLPNGLISFSNTKELDKRYRYLTTYIIGKNDILYDVENNKYIINIFPIDKVKNILINNTDENVYIVLPLLYNVVLSNSNKITETKYSILDTTYDGNSNKLTVEIDKSKIDNDVLLRQLFNDVLNGIRNANLYFYASR